MCESCRSRWTGTPRHSGSWTRPFRRKTGPPSWWSCKKELPGGGRAPSPGTLAARKAGVKLSVPEPLGTQIWQRAGPFVGFDSQFMIMPGTVTWVLLRLMLMTGRRFHAGGLGDQKSLPPTGGKVPPQGADEGDLRSTARRIVRQTPSKFCFTSKFVKRSTSI